jgi:hypothetical protein
VSQVEARDLGEPFGVALVIGDDRSGVRLLGDLDVVRRIVARAGVALAQLAHRDGGR